VSHAPKEAVKMVFDKVNGVSDFYKPSKEKVNEEKLVGLNRNDDVWDVGVGSPLEY